MTTVQTEMRLDERIPTPGRYRHFKGGEYELVGIARHTESGLLLAVYHEVGHPDETWVRPLEMFAEMVEVGGDPRPRFELTEPRSKERAGFGARLAEAFALLLGRGDDPPRGHAHLSI
jgi:hypothetical protein